MKNRFVHWAAMPDGKPVPAFPGIAAGRAWSADLYSQFGVMI
jgi:hypothetical protein